MPLDSSNLMGKAASIFFQFLNLAQKFRVSVQIEKNIPIGAGLAGGSSNAAGMLLGLNELFDRPLNFEQLSLLAAQIGSDVPFCLKGGTCIGRGRGEILSELKSKLQLSLCIVKPRKLSVSTPWAYKSFDNYKGELKKPSIEKALTGLKTADLELALSGFANVFQPLVFQEFPELEKLNQQLIDLGAWASQMSGSGPTLFAVVSGREMGHHLRRQVLRDDDIGFVYGTDEILAEALAPIDFKLAETCDYGVRVLK